MEVLASCHLPSGAFPTLRDVIEEAKKQGCKEKTIGGIVGPRGPAPARYLVGFGPTGAIKILPNIPDDEHLSPSEIANIVRVLKITGFDHYFIDDSDLPDYDYRPAEPS
jgi:hypothetical protein